MLKLGVLLLVVCAGAAGAVVFLRDGAEAEKTHFRLCDTMLEVAEIERIKVGVTYDSIEDPNHADSVLFVDPKLIISSNDSGSSRAEPGATPPGGFNPLPPYETSRIVISAETAEVLSEDIEEAQSAEFNEMLSSLRLEPIDPLSAPWPYTGTSRVGASKERSGVLEFRAPDPGAGIATVHQRAYGGPQSVIFFNCRSQMIVPSYYEETIPSPLCECG
jgi:hypothetical protein